MRRLAILIAMCGVGCGDDGATSLVDGGPTAAGLTLAGTACSTPISASIPGGTIHLVLSSGDFRGVLVADGTPVDPEDEVAFATYTANHDVYVAFALDEPVALQVGSYDTIFDSFITAKDVGAIGLVEFDSASKLDIVAVDPSAQTIELSFSLPVAGFDDRYPPMFEEFVQCRSGVVTGTIKGPYLLF
jgi:hypothetical protein